MPRHQRDLAARQQLLHFFQELESRHVRHDHIGENHVGGLLLEQSKCGIAAIRLKADKTESLTDGDTKFADALLVVHDEQPDAEIVLTQPVTHFALPMVRETTSMNCCTRNGFSTQGAPVSRRVATVSSLAMSPVMKTMRSVSSGRCCTTQAWTSAPFTPPGVRMSETTPRNSPDSNSRTPWAPDSVQTTE